jgi:ABC-2 type transport system ATP-binding protein
MVTTMMMSNQAGATDGALAVVARGVKKTFAGTRARRGVAAVPARVALAGVDLTIPQGQWVALLGPNGSGKSTLLKILATVARPDEGDVSVLGRAVVKGGVLSAGELSVVRGELGVAFQSAALDPLLTVRENLRTAAALFAMSAAHAAEAISRVAESLGLTDRLDQRVSTLSGGLMRRADLARALLHGPRMLLLDEPTTGLDIRAREEFFTALMEARRRMAGEAVGGGGGLTIVLSTHQMEEAQLAQRVVLMHEGRVVADDSPDKLRRALGRTVIRCGERVEAGAPDPAEVLRGMGLMVTVQPLGEVLARAGDEREEDATRRVRAAADRLIELGVAVQVAPPTLGDVYMAMTGRSLAGGGELVGEGEGAKKRGGRR